MAEIPEGMPTPKTYKEWAVARLCGLDFKMPMKESVTYHPTYHNVTVKIGPNNYVHYDQNVVEIDLDEGTPIIKIDGKDVVFISSSDDATDLPDETYYVVLNRGIIG